MAAAVLKKPETDKFQFGPWNLIARKSHILESEGSEREKFESELMLPQLPEMIFAENLLSLSHSSGVELEFTALDALKLVDPEHDLMKVAVANEWKNARLDCEHIDQIYRPFDWTYTTNYKGTLKSKMRDWKVSNTTERIDLEKLKVREKINFYADILLFEDELADNGCAILSVKIRVMPTSFFILMRFYLRVDGVLVRVNDTRLYHEAGRNYILREYTSKEKLVKDLQVPIHIITDPNEISPHLPIKEEQIEKLEFPDGYVIDSSNSES